MSFCLPDVILRIVIQLVLSFLHCPLLLLFIFTLTYCSRHEAIDDAFLRGPSMIRCATHSRKPSECDALHLCKLSQTGDSTRDGKNHEQRETRRVADHISKRRRRDAETLHERELRLANERESRRRKRALETTDQRETTTCLEEC
ncbi:12986_t:CDS:2 [Acaulospora morrowiae]|uniref:12986_t:CDS:1 n=1 Tax=Acaulospora morrowiae TaxID=94023 RepID=A0A9N8YYQ4_9GLOM|nr:12986_t:CDS:2 [Acaulospora morrowiae]